MKLPAEILKAKGDSVVYSIGPSATVYEALALMAEKNVGALLVMEGEKIVGMITERDYARKVVLLARSSKDSPCATSRRQPRSTCGRTRPPRTAWR